MVTCLCIVPSTVMVEIDPLFMMEYIMPLCHRSKPTYVQWMKTFVKPEILTRVTKSRICAEYWNHQLKVG